MLESLPRPSKRFSCKILVQRTLVTPTSQIKLLFLRRLAGGDAGQSSPRHAPRDSGPAPPGAAWHTPRGTPANTHAEAGLAGAGPGGAGPRAENRHVGWESRADEWSPPEQFSPRKTSNTK